MTQLAIRRKAEKSLTGGLRVLLATPEGGRTHPSTTLVWRAPGIELAGRAETESETVRLYFKLRPDVAVLDTRLAADEPARLIGMLRRIAPELRIISLVPSADSMPARAALALGADVITTELGLPAALASMMAGTAHRA